MLYVNNIFFGYEIGRRMQKHAAKVELLLKSNANIT